MLQEQREIIELIEDTLSLYNRYIERYEHAQQAASRVIEDLREDFFEDTMKKMFVVTTLSRKDKSLNVFLRQFITKDDIDFLKNSNQLNETVKTIAYV